MTLTKRISKHFDDSAEIKLQSKKVLAKPIGDAAQAMVNCLMSDGKILICGNGGSAADAQHFAAELMNRFEVERPGLPAVALLLAKMPALNPVRAMGQLATAVFRCGRPAGSVAITCSLGASFL